MADQLVEAITQKVNKQNKGGMARVPSAVAALGRGSEALPRAKLLVDLRERADRESVLRLADERDADVESGQVWVRTALCMACVC